MVREGDKETTREVKLKKGRENPRGRREIVGKWGQIHGD